MSDDKNKSYSEILRKKRRAAEISQEDLAKEMDVSRPTYNKYELEGMSYDTYKEADKALENLISAKAEKKATSTRKKKKKN